MQKFAEGEALLNEGRSLALKLKRRSYSNLLRPAGASGDLALALRVFEMTKESDELELEEEDFVALIAACTAQGDAACLYGTVLPAMSEMTYCVSEETRGALGKWCAQHGAAMQAVSIPRDSGVCPQCSAQQRSIDLTHEEMNVMMQHAVGLAGDKEHEVRQFRDFQEYENRARITLSNRPTSADGGTCNRHLRV